jgi:iron complex transport system substrate-binding protein
MKLLHLALFTAFLLSLGTSQNSPTTFPITVTDSAGNEVKFEAAPQKVVCLTTLCLGTLAFLDETPYAVPDFDFMTEMVYDPNFFEQPLEVQLTEVSEAGPDFEAVLALAPDLVITNGDPVQYEALASFVPTYAPSWQSDPLEMFFLDVRNLARVYGEETQTENKIDALLQRAAAYAKASGREKSYYHIFPAGDGKSFYIDGGAVSCGFVQREGVCSSTYQDEGAEVTVEGLLELNPDVLLWRDDPALLETLESDPLWQELRAFQTEQIFVTEAYLTHGPDTPFTFALWLDTVMPLVYPDIFPQPLSDEQVQEILASEN